MPFELGIAYALAQIRSHSFFVFEEKAFRLQASLSDLNGHDPYIHDRSITGVLRCVRDCFGPSAGAPKISTLESMTRQLMRTAVKLQKEQGAKNPFHPYLFRRISWAAFEMARHHGLIE